MAGRWIHKKPYIRRENGRAIHVRACWVWYENSDQRKKQKAGICPMCNAAILTVPMPNGGWGHFEAGKGLSKVKHPCFTIGNGLSKKKDTNTPDLFETIPTDQ